MRVHFTLQKLCIALGLSLLLSFQAANAQLRVLACEPEWQALVEALGGDHVDVSSATTAFQDPHFIEARPSLIARTRRADLLVCTGAELEIGWLPLLLRQSGNAKIQTGQQGLFLAASQVPRIEVPQELDRSHGDVHASGNPHVHWDPRRLLTIAKALSERLSLIDGENTADYKQKFRVFEDKWLANIERWEQQAVSLKGSQVVVYHKNWSYLLKWLGIEAVGDLEPKPGVPPTSAHLAQLLKTVRAQKIHAIVLANYQESKGAYWLSEKSDIPVAQLPFTVGATPEIQTLESLYDSVIAQLVETVDQESKP